MDAVKLSGGLPMRSTPVRLAGIVSVVLLASTAAGACRESSDPRLVATHARVPDPCALVTGQTAGDLIGVRQGVNTTDPADRSPDPRTRTTAQASCEWRTSDDAPASRKGGLIIATVTVELKHPKGHDDTRRRPEELIPSGVPCTQVTTPRASFACWYESQDGIVVALRKGHADAAIHASGTHSTALDKSAHSKTAERLAGDAIRALR